MAAGVALSIAACGGGGSSAPPPNPLFVSAATGTDGNPGTADKPLRTIGRATQLAGDDYVIVVAPGTYAESVTTDRQGLATAQGLTLLADTNGKVFQEFSGKPRSGKVVIRSTSDGIKLNSSAGTVVDGFTIKSANGGGIVVNKSNNARVENCVVSGAVGDNGDGIRVQNSADVTLFNNLVFDNDRRGIALVSSSPNGQVISNTIARSGVRGVNIGNSTEASSGAYVHNNIIQDNGSGEFGDNIKVFNSAVPSQDSLDGYDGDYNLVFPAGTYDPASLAGDARHDVNEDALFVDATPMTPADFLLQCDNPPSCSIGSPALDAGFALPDPSLQFCLFQWTATGGNNQDHAALDLGYHAPDNDPLCAVGSLLPATPTPTPTSTPTQTATPTATPSEQPTP